MHKWLKNRVFFANKCIVEIPERWRSSDNRQLWPKKSSEFLTEEEWLKSHVKELETQNNHLKLENAFAKKVTRDSMEKPTFKLVGNISLYQAISVVYEDKLYI